MKSKKPGPKEVAAGSLYSFAQQAYWGFRFLSENEKKAWKRIQAAESIEDIQQVGRDCALGDTMRGASYGAAGLMTWLETENVAREVLAAKRHRRYPKPGLPKTEDRRRIFLGIAVAAGVFESSFATALRKLPEAKLGIQHLADDVHVFDRLREMIADKAVVWAESVTNYYWPVTEGKWELMRDLPCQVPADWHGGYVIHGYQASGPLATFSRTLPVELLDLITAQHPNLGENQSYEPSVSLTKTAARSHAVCECGATIAAASRKIARKVLADHKRLIHGTISSK